MQKKLCVQGNIYINFKGNMQLYVFIKKYSSLLKKLFKTKGYCLILFNILVDHMLKKQ